MALLHADNFGWYTKSQLLRYYNDSLENGLIQIGPFGRSGGSGIRFSGNTGDFIENESISGVSGVVAIMQFDLRLSTASAGSNALASISDGSTEQVSMVINTDQTISVYRGSAAGTLLGTSSYAIPLNTYIHIGWKTTVGNTGSSVVHVWEDGDAVAQVVLNLTGVDTQNTASAQWNGYGIGPVSTGSNDFCNWVVMDGSGTTNKDLLGPLDVVSRYPNGSGNNSEWARSTGVDQWRTVDDPTSFDDVDFNAADSVNLVDVLEMEDMPSPDQTLYGVVAVRVLRREGSGSVSVASVMRQGSTNTVGSAVSPGADYETDATPYDTLPDGAPWTAAGWNAVQLGYKRTA